MRFPIDQIAAAFLRCLVFFFVHILTVYFDENKEERIRKEITFTSNGVFW